MVPKVIARGRSFKGAARYLLHDKGHALTSERVAWTETRNLAVDNPHHAWRIMAATALDQNRLKETAGIKSTGRKSDRAVLHLSLAWHSDEKQGLTQEEMMKAARGALRALGADDRQALIIAHSDEAHPHLHILCNRVSPDDGRMLPSSKEKLALSRWAETYEKERGTIHCEERVLNNEARDAGIYTRGEKPKSRREAEEREQLSGVANDNDERVAKFFREQRARDAALAEDKRSLMMRQRQQWTALKDAAAAKAAQIENTRARAQMRAERVLNDRAKGLRRNLLHKQRQERAVFEKREAQLLGRMQNAFQVLRLPEHVRGDVRGTPLTSAFGILASSERRRQALEREQKRQRQAVLRQIKRQHGDIRRRLTKIADDGRAKLDWNIVQQSSTLRFTHAYERSALRAKQRQRASERRREFSEFQQAYEKAIKAERSFTEASSGTKAQDQAEKIRHMQQLIKAKLERDRSRGDRER